VLYEEALAGRRQQLGQLTPFHLEFDQQFCRVAEGSGQAQEGEVLFEELWLEETAMGNHI